jgi:hypothetical protein
MAQIVNAIACDIARRTGGTVNMDNFGGAQTRFYGTLRGRFFTCKKAGVPPALCALIEPSP